MQFTLNGRRRSVFLDAKYARQIAKEVSFYVDELASAAEFDMPITRRAAAWLESIDGDLRERLGRAGLVASNKNVSIGELVELYMEAESPSMKPTTIATKRKYFQQASSRLDFYLKASRLCGADVIALKLKLDQDFAEATRAGILKALSRVYSWGKDLDYVAQNPFAAIPKGSFENKSREVFVPMETYYRLVENCADAELRVLLSFYRVGGMRLSEAFEARWEDVDWAAERFTVRSPKTERVGKAFRVIPLFEEIRTELEKLKSETQGGRTDRSKTSRENFNLPSRYQTLQRAWDSGMGAVDSKSESEPSQRNIPRRLWRCGIGVDWTYDSGGASTLPATPSPRLREGFRESVRGCKNGCGTYRNPSELNGVNRNAID